MDQKLGNVPAHFLLFVKLEILDQFLGEWLYRVRLLRGYPHSNIACPHRYNGVFIQKVPINLRQTRGVFEQLLNYLIRFANRGSGAARKLLSKPIHSRTLDHLSTPQGNKLGLRIIV
jgi:hypothetical protein